MSAPVVIIDGFDVTVAYPTNTITGQFLTEDDAQSWAMQVEEGQPTYADLLASVKRAGVTIERLD